MHDVLYHTVVGWLPPTPLGLLPGRWAIHHRCNLCRHEVTTDQLITHAESHRSIVTITNDPHSRDVC